MTEHVLSLEDTATIELELGDDGDPVLVIEYEGPLITQQVQVIGGTAASVPLDPAIAGLGTTVQSAVSALNNKPAVAKLRDLTDVNMGTQPNSGIPIYNSATQIFNLESQLDGGNF